MKTKLNKSVFITLLAIGAGYALVFGVLGLIPFLNIFTGLLGFCLSWLILPVFAGWYATSKHKITKEMLADGLIVGAIGGAALGVGIAILNVIFSLIGSVLGLGLTSVTSSFDDVGFSGAEFAAAGAFSTVAGIIGACILIFSSIVVAAIAGLILAAITQQGGQAEQK